MAKQRVVVRELEQAPQLRSMAVGSYGVAVQRVDDGSGIRSFLKSFEGLAEAGVNLEQASAKENKELAEAEVAKLTPEQLRKLQRGVSADVPLSGKPFVLKMAEEAAGELAMREAVGGKIQELARSGVRGGGDPMEAYSKATSDVFSGLGKGYQAVGASKIKRQYDQQFEAAIANETEKLTVERISASLNKNIGAALSNMVGDDGFDADKTRSQIQAIYSEASSAGVSPKMVGESIAANISRVEDPDLQRNYLLAARGVVIDEKNGLTLGTVLPEDYWDAVESKIENGEKEALLSESRQLMSLQEFGSLNKLMDVSGAIGDDAKMASVEDTDMVASVKALPQIDNEGEYANNSRMIEQAVSQGNNSAAVSMLVGFAKSGRITQPEFKRLTNIVNDAYSLRGLVSQRLDGVRDAINNLAKVPVTNVELEDMRSIYRRNLLSEISTYRSEHPEATQKELQTQLTTESGLVQKALASSTKEVEARDAQIGEEKSKILADEEKQKELRNKSLELSIPWASEAINGLNKASDRFFAFTQKYNAPSVKMGSDEIIAAETLNKWRLQKAAPLAKSIADKLVSGVHELPVGDGGFMKETPINTEYRDRYIATYRAAKDTLGYSYDELAAGVTRDGISLEDVIGENKINYFAVPVFANTKELDEVKKDAKKMDVYKKTIGVVNFAEFEKRQRTLLKLTGKK